MLTPREAAHLLGVSYPTIKARLHRLAATLDLVETDPGPERGEVIDQLARGEIDAEEAIRLMEAAP